AAVDDCGNQVNPMIVAGQLHGGIVQGVAQALWEEAVYDEDGQLRNATLTDYLVPSAAELPSFKLDHTVTPSPTNEMGVKGVGEAVAVGALTRHRDLETSDVLAEHLPLLRHAAGQVGDPQVRHRGTIGGSLAHGDPASDLPAVLLALRATMVVRGPKGDRDVPIDSFFTGFLETALRPDEVLVEMRVPKMAGAG